ncbi:MAG: NAD(+)/NADH kinase [Dehalococcoidales bacterium]|nr:NAD(+)/NADH kinase [Dehalococcoidales bacterium]
MNIKKVGILYHPMVEATLAKAKELESSLTMQGVAARVCSSWEKEEIQTMLEGTDLLLTVGGDGTILRAVQAVIPGTTPITGINQGKLGFMTELDAAEAIQKLPLLFAGQGWLDERTMLQAELVAQGQETRVFHALNDVVIARGEIPRIIRIDAAIDGQPLATFKTDALVISTATGSTGYALAARGPIMHPQSRDILLVPVAPHLCLSYPLVLPETTEIRLRVNTYHPAALSVDGHINMPISDGDTIIIKRSPHVARFFRIRAENSFYLSLEDKLRGKQGESGRKS